MLADRHKIMTARTYLASLFFPISWRPFYCTASWAATINVKYYTSVQNDSCRWLFLQSLVFFHYTSSVEIMFHDMTWHARQSTVCCSQSWSWPRHAIINSTRPGHCHWQWCHHADSCVKDCIGVFCSLATAPIHQALGVRNRVQVVGRIVGYATPRLQRQRDTCRASCLPAPTSAVGPQCCRQTGSSFV